MKSFILLLFVLILSAISFSKPILPYSKKDTVKKSTHLRDWFKVKKQKKMKKTQDVGCWICEPLDYASDTINNTFIKPKDENPCSAFVFLLLLPVMILIAVVVAIYAAFIVFLILLLGSGILFGLYALLLLSMGIALAGWYLWGGIIGAIVVFTTFYFLFCRFCRLN